MLPIPYSAQGPEKQPISGACVGRSTSYPPRRAGPVQAWAGVITVEARIRGKRWRGRNRIDHTGALGALHGQMPLMLRIHKNLLCGDMLFVQLHNVVNDRLTPAVDVRPRTVANAIAG